MPNKTVGMSAEESAAFDEDMRAAAEEASADIMFYCGRVSDSGVDQVLSAISTRKNRRKNIYLFLTTLGGSPDAAFRIARQLRRSYKDGRLILLIDWYCKSAGTLLAIGSHEIVMSDRAELGPLDTQLQKPDELEEMTSGLTTFQALKSLRTLVYDDFQEFFFRLRFGSENQISTKTAADVASQLVVGLYEPIYAQIDPVRLGEHARAMLIAEAYGKELGEGQVQGSGLSKLISEYPSHSFVLDRDQAEALFSNVRAPTEKERAVMQRVHAIVEKHVDRGTPVVAYLVDEPAPGAQHAGNGTASASTPTNTESSGHRAGGPSPGDPGRVMAAGEASVAGEPASGSPEPIDGQPTGRSSR